MSLGVESPPRPRALYGRRQGRALRPAQRHVLNTLGAHISFSLQGAPLCPVSLFSSPCVRRVWLEIGFGNGTHMLHQLRAHEDVGFVGCEVYRPGIAQCLRRASELKERLRLYEGDARDLLSVLAPNSLSCVFLLFPDPWAKRRHHKRRLLQGEIVAHLARVLEPTGQVQIVTDNPGFACWMKAQMEAYFVAALPAPTPPMPPTRYQTKAKPENCVSLRFTPKRGFSRACETV